MKIGIRYQADYIYDEEASFSPHRVRLFPRTDLFARVERITFAADPSADVQYRRDLFDNVIAFCFFPNRLKHLPYSLSIDMDLLERNPFHFLLDSHALRIPFLYQPEEASMLAPYLANPGNGQLPGVLTPGSPVPSVERILTLNRWIFENLEYERRDEGMAWAPGETLANGRGACRDFAVLLADVLRRNGIASRLASGFLWEPPEMAAADRRADSALHAWVEAFLPGPGWIGLDPTNGILCDHHFITTAVGLTPADVAPVQGFYYGKKAIASRLESTLSITPGEN